MTLQAVSAQSGPQTMWMQDAAWSPGPEAPALRGRTTADVCIVGGGFTGLWTAIAIKERRPSTDVVLVEAKTCGAGASGANGGFAMTWWPKYTTLRRMLGADAGRVAQLSQDAVESIGRFTQEQGIDAQFTPAGWLWAATSAAQLGAWDETVEALSGTGYSPFTALDPVAATEMSGSDLHLGGVFEAGVATLHPGLLVRGLRDHAIGLGVRIHEHTPMSELNDATGGTLVRTRGGDVVAEQCVLATNAALVQFREVRRHLIVLGSDVVATRPAPEVLERLGWDEGLAISDSRRLVHYYRTTVDGRVVFGKGGGKLGFGRKVGPGFTGESVRRKAVAEQLFRLYPRLREVGVSHAWTGAVDYSVDGVPFFGTLDRRTAVHYVAGYSGDGVGPSYLAGQVLASRVLQTDDEWARIPLVRTPHASFPVEPVRFLGGQVVRKALERKEHLEDAGRTPSRGLTLIADLDPTSFVG